jgi:cellulose synthase/poly-beta-1,6-N-acetylglucosamine synthase-like glycosyltransferase
MSRLYRRFKKLVISAAASALRPISLPHRPTYSPSKDVTVIVPTIDPGIEFGKTLLSFARNHPLEILVITSSSSFTTFQELVDEAMATYKNGLATVKILTVTKPSKRRQMALGIRQALGKIIVFADDDVFWPPKMLPHLLACFEDPLVGGAGVLQRAFVPSNIRQNLWHFLATYRLERRMQSISANIYIDGGMTCLSGRSVAYRAEILKAERFIDAFTHDYWYDRYLLDSGDDVFITHWLYSNNWRIQLQSEPMATISITIEGSSKFVLQLLRWARNSKRCSIRCLLWRLWMFR